MAGLAAARRSARAWRSTLIAVAAVLGAGVAASPALGATYTLNLSAPPTATVGQPIIIQATGSNPADDFFSSWLEVHAIPASVLSACPDGYLNAHQVAESTYAQGGQAVATSQRENVDEAGNFSMPIAWSPKMAGRFLICGYTNDGAAYTQARASLIMDVQALASPPPTGSPPPSGSPPPQIKPANVGKPSVRRVGKQLVCNRGNWSNNPSRYSYGWLVNGKRQRDASGRKLRVTRKLRGRKVRCSVKAYNAAGATTALSRSLRVR